MIASANLKRGSKTSIETPNIKSVATVDIVAAVYMALTYAVCIGGKSTYNGYSSPGNLPTNSKVGSDFHTQN